MWKLLNKHGVQLEILSDLDELMAIAEEEYEVEVIEINYNKQEVRIKKSKQEW